MKKLIISLSCAFSISCFAAAPTTNALLTAQTITNMFFNLSNNIVTNGFPRFTIQQGNATIQMGFALFTNLNSDFTITGVVGTVTNQLKTTELYITNTLATPVILSYPNFWLTSATTTNGLGTNAVPITNVVKATIQTFGTNLTNIVISYLRKAS